jgi:hypothetical protein
MVPPPLLLLLAAAQLAIGAADEAPPPPPLRCHPDANPPEVCPGGDPCPQCGADVCDCPGPAPPPPPGCPFFARDILLDLYNSTDGENWKKHDGWDSADAPCCEWHGVRCDELACSALSRCCPGQCSSLTHPARSCNHNSSAITKLRLAENLLKGTLVESLGLLDGLEELVIYGNKELTGTIPERYF